MSIKVNDISKYYGRQIALNKVRLNVDAGEVVGFLGPNGAGKSTLMKILTGFIPADKGSASVCGLEVSPEATGFRGLIGYLPEHNPLYPEMYVREYLSVVAGFYKLKSKKAEVEKVIEMTGLAPEMHKKIGALSKGYRQRVGLAQALIHDPQVLILDEPTSGLDPNQLEEIRQLIIRISKHKTVMLSTHIMQEVEALCNRVIIINKGEIIADSDTASVKKMALTLGQQVELETADVFDVGLLEKLPFVASVQHSGGKSCIITAKGDNDIRPLLFKWAVDQKITIVTLHEKSSTIENVFMDLTR